METTQIKAFLLFFPVAAAASDHTPYFSRILGVQLLSCAGSFGWVQELAKPGTLLSGWVPRVELCWRASWRPWDLTNPQRHAPGALPSVPAECPVGAAPQSQASAALCCMLEIGKAGAGGRLWETSLCPDSVRASWGQDIQGTGEQFYDSFSSNKRFPPHCRLSGVQCQQQQFH